MMKAIPRRARALSPCAPFSELQGGGRRAVEKRRVHRAARNALEVLSVADGQFLKGHARAARGAAAAPRDRQL
eukprot:5487330-Pyramimonas_sp.AAC.1